MFHKPIALLLFALMSLTAGPIFAQMPSQSAFQSALKKIIADDEHEYTAYRGTQEKGVFASTLIIPGTHQNRIHEPAQFTTYTYFEAYIKEGMSKEEAIALEKDWRALISKSLPGYSVVGPTVISTDFEKTEFTSNETHHPVILTLYRDLNNKAFRLSFSIKRLAPKAAQAGAVTSTTTTGGDYIQNLETFKKNIAAIIMARTNGFAAYKGTIMDGTKPGEKMALVNGYHFPGDPAGFEMIKIGADGKATFTVMFGGLVTPAMAAVAYNSSLTEDMKKDGYSISKVEKGTQTDYTISKDGIPVSLLRLEPENAKGSLVVLGQ